MGSFFFFYFFIFQDLQTKEMIDSGYEKDDLYYLSLFILLPLFHLTKH